MGRYINKPGLANALTHRLQRPGPEYEREDLSWDEFTEPPEQMVQTHPPVWNFPNFMAKPYDKEGAFTNIPFFETSYPIFQSSINASSLLRITGISYDVTCMVQYSVFVWSVYRSGQLLSSWEDILINPASANPANRWALAGSTQMLPYYGRFDRADTLTATVRARGVEPFGHTPADPALCAARICFSGWVSHVEDERDSKSRAAEFGEMSSLPAGEQDDPSTIRLLPKEIQDAWSGRR